MIKNFLLCCAILFSVVSSAQQFKYEAPLPKVDSTGFYKILLAPGLNARLLGGFTDLRLVDSSHKEIPYVLKNDNPVTTSSIFKEYEIVEKKFLKDSATVIILKNNKNESINNVSLLIRNAEVQKTMSLSGSFDRKQWFVLKESDLIYSVRNEKEVAEIKLIDFPLTNYTFLKIVINDKRSSPLDIIKAGYYESSTVKGSYTPLKSSLTVSDSAKSKTTWAHIIFNEEIIPDETEISISEPPFYMRSANVYYSNNNSKKGERYFLTSITINSKASKRFQLEGQVRAKELWFEIINEDNPPLKISDITCFQLNHFCIAQLEKDKQYWFRFGDSALSSPRYDLKYFENIIPSSMKEINHGEISSIKQPPAEAEKAKSIFTDKRYIWAALILIISLLGFVSFRMVKETN